MDYILYYNGDLRRLLIHFVTDVYLANFFSAHRIIFFLFYREINFFTFRLSRNNDLRRERGVSVNAE